MFRLDDSIGRGEHLPPNDSYVRLVSSSIKKELIPSTTTRSILALRITPPISEIMKKHHVASLTSDLIREGPNTDPFNHSDITKRFLSLSRARRANSIGTTTTLFVVSAASLHYAPVPASDMKDSTDTQTNHSCICYSWFYTTNSIKRWPSLRSLEH